MKPVNRKDRIKGTARTKRAEVTVRKVRRLSNEVKDLEKRLKKLEDKGNP